MMIRGRVWATALAVGAMTLSGVVTTWADTITIGPNDDIHSAVDGLLPGDELVLSGGTYTLSSRFDISVSGTDSQPIIIRAADGEVPIVEYVDGSQNVINIENNEYVELRGVEVRGGSHGIRITDADYITVEDCHIHDTADVGISANVGGSNYEGLRLVGNHIHHTADHAEGMYLGCNNDGCQMHHSLIAGNYIHHTNVNVSQGDGIEIKEGSHDNVVRDNVIHDTNYPCIITYATVGNGGPNIIERNVMWNCGDHAIQSAADSVIRNNIILSANYNGISLQPHQSGSPGNQVVVHNTIINPGGESALRASGVVGSLLIANNALFSESGYALRVAGDMNQVTIAGNVGSGNTEGVSGGFENTGDITADFVAASYAGGPPNDVFPAPGGALVAAGDEAHVADDDFNGTLREGVADVGAYKFDANGNPGWVITEDFKDDTPTTGGGGPGGSGTGGSGTGAGSTGGSGTGGSGTGGTGTGGAGNAPVGVTPEDDSGCGCRVVGSAPRNAGALGLLGWLLVVGRVRRRR